MTTGGKSTKLGGKNKPIKDLEGLPEQSLESIESGPQSSGASQMGLNNTNIPEAVPFHNQAECETVFKNGNNSWIILGRDRPGPLNSGYGGMGATQAASIDIVCGKMGATKAGPKSNIYANPNFAGDAARIYISQKTDIDKNFGLVAGNVGLSVARSAVGIKADAVRLIGREGIKLVTGTVPIECVSGGEPLTTTYGIDLIAGNDDETVELEPIPKGNRLAQTLLDMNNRINELNGLYTTLLTALLVHVHPVAFGSIALPSPNLAIQGIVQCMVPAYGHKVKIMANETNNLQTYGSNYINSRFNRVN
tara:strand:+ start:13304 stop:14224 length:921 start_codon:yes stop_codon:yes gene_type:complete